MAHRLQVLLSREQYEFLDAEADRSSVSMAELIRRAIDTTYGVDGTRGVFVITHTLGRRVGRRLRD
ncbi:MAG TPA: ribbon-helix-helix protein, CopG family [Gaiellaceae bacterium]|nr:ribbon-helix-helix protein, CopG family [Gaiellaceae bacterium]